MNINAGYLLFKHLPSVGSGGRAPRVVGEQRPSSKLPPDRREWAGKMP